MIAKFVEILPFWSVFFVDSTVQNMIHPPIEVPHHTDHQSPRRAPNQRRLPSEPLPGPGAGVVEGIRYIRSVISLPSALFPPLFRNHFVIFGVLQRYFPPCYATIGEQGIPFF